MGDGVPADRCQALVGARVVGIGREPATVGPARGDIHIVDFPDVGGHVIRGPHPGVIVQTDRMRRSSTVVVVPLTRPHGSFVVGTVIVISHGTPSLRQVDCG